jgi:hypothetical protein
MMQSPSSLPITGYRNQSVANTFARQDAETDHLAIVLPGYNYSSQMPGLFYPILFMSEQGADILSVDYAYGASEEFARASGEERSARMAADITAACSAGLAQREYHQITLIGKSLGTRGMAHLLEVEERLRAARCIWLTPLLRAESLRASIAKHRPRSLFVIGTADDQYDEELLPEVVYATGGSSLVLDGVNHGLNVPGDALASIRCIEKVIEAIADFIQSDTRS